MADQPTDKTLLPSLLEQNPAPWVKNSQDRRLRVQEQVSRIMSIFRQLVPSNYVSQVPGPFYMAQFESVAERIADFQITAQETFADSCYDYTRSEVLYQIMGSLVFPEANTHGYPEIDGDLTYRTFLQRMIELLLTGSKATVLQAGIELLTDATVEVIERGIEARKLKGTSAWGPGDEFTLEINISQEGATISGVTFYKFPADTFTLQRNVQLVLKALKPAHTIYAYRHLFKDTFGTLFTEASSWTMESYYYQDFRRYWLGAAAIEGRAGITWLDRTLFSDHTRDFSSVLPGSVLTLLSGPNMTAALNLNSSGPLHQEDYPSNYRVLAVAAFAVQDSTPRPYTTTSGLAGFGTVVDDTVLDVSQLNWHQVIDGDLLTFSSGPNAGSYLIKFVLGTTGGPAGKVPAPPPGYPPLIGVKIAPSILRLQRRMAVQATGQSYRVGVDRLGVQSYRAVIEDVTSQFMGPGPDQTFVLTAKGPLVKAWGDMTPATLNDVAVYVSGALVAVSDVNPYIGKITLVNPVVRFLPGDPAADARVIYNWFPTPVFELLLDTEGSVLDQWDRATGHDDPAAHGSQIQEPGFPKGAVSLARFPMGTVVGPTSTPQPLYIGHRYIGFEKEYSALLDSPTTLLLDSNPNVIEVPGFDYPTDGLTVAYEAITLPTAASPVWTLEGVDAGQLNTDGTYTVKDEQEGPPTPADPKVAAYLQDIDLTFPCQLTLVGRLIVDDPILPAGVFTGVGLGCHDNHHLYMLGCLSEALVDPLSDPVQLVGLLTDATQMHSLDGWDIGPKADGTILTTTTVSTLTAATPIGFKIGSRFIFLDGTQQGVYTATNVIRHSDGTTETTVSPAFPADPHYYGNKYHTVYFETLWDDAYTTYRLTIDPVNQVAVGIVSGRTTGEVATLNGTASDLTQPAETFILLDTTQKGQVFWGALMPDAKSESTWSFVRYGLEPDQTAIRGYTQLVNTEMTVVPEVESSDDWFLTEDYGYSNIPTPNDLLLKSTSENDSLNFSFGYKRIECFITPEAGVDLSTDFKVETGVLGAGDAEIVIDNGQKIVRFATLLYYEDVANTPYRQLIRMPAASMAGVYLPEEQGWTLGMGAGGVCVEPDLEIDAAAGETTLYVASLDTSSLVFPDTGGRIGEARVGIQSTADPGQLFVMTIPTLIGVRLHLVGPAAPAVQLRDMAGGLVQSYNFDWTDGELHTYRLVVSGGAVGLFLDETLMFPLENTANFPTLLTGSWMSFGINTPTAAVTSQWRAVSYSALPPAAALRTFGIWTGGDKDDINSWEIPRTDTSAAANSEQVGPVIEEMDWRALCEVRILRDPIWGVTMYRPDLPLPPYYVPWVPGTPGTGFTTPLDLPSAGWINVEHPNLPPSTATIGSISFGALDSRALTQQHWTWMRYKVFKTLTPDYRSPEHMVLDQCNIITSGELNRDLYLEQASVQPYTKLDETYVPAQTLWEVSLIPAHLFAKDVWKVIDNGTLYDRSAWSFDVTAQTVTFKDGYVLTGNPVDVYFIPGYPITTTYLLTQPLLDSVTRLNEGTPPMPKSQMAPDVLDMTQTGETLGPPLTVAVYEEDPAALYEGMEFMEIQDTGDRGLIASIGEGFLPTGFSGYTVNEGTELIYSPTGGGAPLGGVGPSHDLFATADLVGASAGSAVWAFSGTMLWEKSRTITDNGFGKGGHPRSVMGRNLWGPLRGEIDLDKMLTWNHPFRGAWGPGPEDLGLGSAMMTMYVPSTGVRTVWTLVANPP